MPQRIAAICLIIGALFISSRATAAELSCRFEKQLDELAALRESPESDPAAELKIRQDLLRNVLDCSLAEVKTLQSAVQELASNDPDIEGVRGRFSEKINEVINYYEAQKSRVADLDISGSKEAAKDIRERRLAAYVPLAERTPALAIWIQNQDLFRAAERRFQEISRTVKVFKLVDVRTVSDLLERAGDNFRRAQALNGEVRQVLGQFETPADTLALLKTSLEALSQTYQTFFDLSGAVGAALSLR